MMATVALARGDHPFQARSLVGAPLPLGKASGPSVESDILCIEETSTLSLP